MAMKTILAPIPDTAVNTAAIETALMVAKAVAGHVEALFIARPPPAVPLGGYAGYETASYDRAAVAARRAEEQLARDAAARERAAEQARAEFRRLCAASGVPICTPDAFSPLPSASWSQTQGSYADAVTARAPAHDLMVVPNPSQTTPAREIAEHTLLDTGRPVLLAAAQAEVDPSGAAMIAWAPGLPAWRAVAAAVPLLATARRVELVTVGADEADVAASRAEVMRYLGWHGITATARHVKPASRSVGDALLHEASEARTGMLVMGAYSHSRLRELLLGGVTRHVLVNAAVTPIFLAH
jgi:nucleotide-binding universal stress UspA family protein